MKLRQFSEFAHEGTACSSQRDCGISSNDGRWKHQGTQFQTCKCLSAKVTMKRDWRVMVFARGLVSGGSGCPACVGPWPSHSGFPPNSCGVKTFLHGGLRCMEVPVHSLQRPAQRGCGFWYVPSDQPPRFSVPRPSREASKVTHSPGHDVLTLSSPAYSSVAPTSGEQGTVGSTQDNGRKREDWSEGLRPPKQGPG